MISVRADIAGQSQHAADWLHGWKEQGPSPVLAQAKRQMEELEVDWANTFAVPETESVTVPRQKKKRTEEPTATSRMQRSRAWCGTPPILGVVNMVGTRNFTCYMGAL